MPCGSTASVGTAEQPEKSIQLVNNAKNIIEYFFVFIYFLLFIFALKPLCLLFLCFADIFLHYFAVVKY